MAELKSENPRVNLEKTRRTLLITTIAGIVVWGGFAFAAAAMLVSLGAWPWVAYPFAIYWWNTHIAKAVQTYRTAFKPKPKWEQNIVMNVYPSAELTPEQIASAAERAVNERLQYGV